MNPNPASDVVGFLTQPADPKYNSDGLPVGIAKARCCDDQPWPG